MSWIELKDVSRNYDLAHGAVVHALHDVTLQIEQGEFLCLTGPSGSGKTTLLSILGCLNSPSDGEYIFDGHAIQNLGDEEQSQLRREQFGFVFQSANLLDYATLIENIELPATFTSLDFDSRRSRAMELLDRVELSKRVDHRPFELSGGEKQRVSIARAMMNGARVILADEPTAALDDDQKHSVLQLLEELVGSGYTVIVASHDPDVAARAHRLVNLHEGRIQGDNQNQDIRSDLDSHVWVESGSHGPAPASARLSNSLHSFRRMLKLSWAWYVAMVLVVSLSTATMLTVLSIVKGTDDFTSAILAKIGATKMTVSSSYNDDGLARPKFDESVVQHLRDRVPQIEDIALVFRQPIQVSSGAAPSNGNVWAESILRHRWLENVEWSIESGRLLTERDSELHATVAVIGQTVRERLFSDGRNPIGERFFLGGLPFTVIGLLSEHPYPPGIEHKGLREMERRTAGLSVFIPFRTAIEILVPLLETEGNVTPVAMHIYVDEISNVPSASEQIHRQLTESFGPETFNIRSSVDHIEWMKSNDSKKIRYWMMIVLILFFACGTILMSLIHVSVSKRTSEIGILRAFGARRRDVLEQWLVEALTLCLVGGLLGYAIAYIAMQGGLAETFGLYSSIDPWFLIPAIFASLGIGICFGSYPLLRAAKVHPTEALQMN